MKILNVMPEQLKYRCHGRHLVPVECSCGELMAWPKYLGNRVVCTRCKQMEELDIVDAPENPVTPDAPGG